MNKIITAALLLIFLTALPAISLADVQSLRGHLPLAAGSADFDKKKQDTSVKGFFRAWKTQPPVISHKIEKDRINLQENTCMKCHSEEESVFSGAPPTPDSHSLDAEAKKLNGISMRRYFCTQCHVTQKRTKPLIENAFAPALTK